MKRRTLLLLVIALLALALITPAAIAQDDDDGTATATASSTATADDDDRVTAAARGTLPRTGGPALISPIAGALLIAGGVAGGVALRRSLNGSQDLDG